MIFFFDTFCFLLIKYKIHYMASLQAHTYLYNIHALFNQYNNITPINPLGDIICSWAWLETVFFPYLEILQIIRFKAEGPAKHIFFYQPQFMHIGYDFSI